MEIVLILFGFVLGYGVCLFINKNKKVVVTSNLGGGVGTEKDGSKTTQGNQST